jgi:hypothetical protein
LPTGLVQLIPQQQPPVPAPFVPLVIPTVIPPVIAPVIPTVIPPVIAPVVPPVVPQAVLGYIKNLNSKTYHVQYGHYGAQTPLYNLAGLNRCTRC